MGRIRRECGIRTSFPGKRDLSNVIYQAWGTVFHYQMKHWEESWKYDAAAEYFWRTSRCLIEWWNAVSNAWYYFSNKMNLEGEIKDAKMSGFSYDFQTLMNYWWAWEGTLGDLKTKLHLSFRTLWRMFRTSIAFISTHVFKVVLYLSMCSFQILLLLTRCILVLVNTLIT